MEFPASHSPYGASVTAAIVAGGQSRRMGQSKALLPLGDATLLEQIHSQLSPFPHHLLSVAHPDQCPSLGLPLCLDNHPNIGPMGGLQACLSQMETPLLFITACDTPFYLDTIAQQLLDHMANHTHCAVARWEGRVHPLLAVYRKTALPTVNHHIAQGNYKMMALLDALSAQVVDIQLPEGAFLGNLNTPKDYQQALTHWQTTL